MPGFNIQAFFFNKKRYISDLNTSPMKFVRSVLLLIFSFYCIFSFSQATLSEKQQKIASAIASYFKLDRENIHLHLNKTTYLTNEQIWFKGYIIEKKFKPSLNTSNLFISLTDAKRAKDRNPALLWRRKSF